MKSRQLSGVSLVTFAFTLIAVLTQSATGSEVPETIFISDKHYFVKNIAPLLVQQPVSQVVKVTGVKLNSTSTGIELVLQTSLVEALKPVNKTEGNSFIADIPNAVLELPDGKEFRSQNPVNGIVSVTVTELDASSIRVTVVGEASSPKVELFDDPEGLVFGFTPAPSAQTQTQPTPQQKPGNQTQPTQPSASGDQPIELVVTGEQDGYNTPDASTATKTDTPLRDIPQSIQVIPANLIQDQGAVRLNEAVRNVSGVAISNTTGNTKDGYTIRGFGANVFRNGFLDDNSSTSTFRDSANIERVEVLKGPASVLFGRLEPSGIINVVTKKPLASPYYNLSFTAGSYSFYRPTLDFSSPLTEDGKLGYRLNIAYENSGSFRDFVHTERFLIAPVISWKIGDNTNLTFEGEYLHVENPLDRGLVTIGNKIADIPISRYLSDPRNQLVADESKTYLTLNHDFNQNLSLRTAFRVTTQLYTNNRFDVEGFSASNNGILDLTSYPRNGYFETYFLQNDLTAKFNTGSVKHTVLLGVELGRLYENQKGESANAGSINIFNPVYNFSYGSYEPEL